ncbi:MAG: hypothetical protein ACREHE_10275 [Rhizomicrobium sp.]
MAATGLQYRRGARKARIAAIALTAGLALAACREAACPAPDLALLGDGQKAALAAFLEARPELRVPDESECGCAQDLDDMRRHGSGGWPQPDYQPYLAVGDFNGDGEKDFAVVVVDASGGARVAIFNGPFPRYSPATPAGLFRFEFRKFTALFIEKDNGRLLLGQFGTEGCVYVPAGPAYEEQCTDED